MYRSGRRPCSDLTGDRFRLLAGDHFVPSFGRGPFCSIFWQGTILFHLLAGNRFVPSFGRGPFCSIFWQGTVLFHLLAGDRFVPSFGRGPFVPSFGRGPFVPSFGRGPFCTFLSGAPNVVLDISSRRHPTRQWSRTRTTALPKRGLDC